MPKWIVHLFFICLYVLIMFFGLGPVLLADGTSQERTVTFLIVLLLYMITTYGFWRVLRRRR